MCKKITTNLLLLATLCITMLTITSCSFGKHQTNTYEIEEAFDNISIEIDTADITFLPSADDVCIVTVYEKEDQQHAVEVNNGTLTIGNDKNRQDYIQIGYNVTSITVYLPKTEYYSLVIEESTGDITVSNDFDFNNISISVTTGDVECYASASENIDIETTTGDIFVEGVTSKSLDLTTTSGKITASSATCDGDITVGFTTGGASLTDISCKNVIANGSTGNISLNNVISEGKFSIDTTTGGVQFKNSDAAEIFVNTTTGNVKGSLLTDKVFIVETTTGDIDVPKSIVGDRCEIGTTTGDIKISISGN